MYKLIFRAIMIAGAVAVCYGYTYGYTYGGAHVLNAFVLHKGLVIKDGKIWGDAK